jgi:outer membrane protein assembly factor BamB
MRGPNRCQRLACLIMAGLLAPPFSVALAQPVITANPETGPPTGTVSVSGTGFGADEAVDLYFDTADLALATTGSNGAFTGIRLTTPVSATPGAHWITGIGRRTGFAAQAKFIVQTDWREFREDPTRQGYNFTENTLNVANVSGMELRWSANIDVFTSSPAVASGIAYVGSYDYNLHAMDAVTGQPLWSAPTKFDIDCSPAVADGVVYVGSDDTNLYAFNAATGEQIWKAGTGFDVASSPAVVDGTVYVGSSETEPTVHGVLYAINAKTGKTIWTATTGGQIVYSSPAIANGVVYVGSDDSKLYAFDTATGQPLWSALTGGAIEYSSPAVANGIVYVGSDKLYAFNAMTGQQIWSAATGNAIWSSPAVADGLVYAGSIDTYLYAFSAATGQQLWKAAAGGQIYDSPAVANGVVYISSSGEALLAFNAATGQLLWSGALAGNTFSSPAVANGFIYVASGSLNAFALPSAEPPVRPAPATLRPDLTLLPHLSNAVKYPRR